MENYKKNWFKFIIGFVACFLARLLPFRPPNIEPILATQMPFAKAYGKLSGFLFAASSIILYDIVTNKIGIWTLVTALAYGLLALWASTYFKNRKNTSINYAKFAIMGTIAYDIVTGLSIGPIFFHQTFTQALVGQIPFTILHLIGNVSFAFLLSPLIYKYVIENKKLESKSIITIFNLKQI
ncbi:hypothetical protein IT400_01480 [Candidatus Nomurabacteria bacterium]|nr:hypothetical protein [Candidatus Nomurabacteria bacterium]